jgi:WD40 repeat protein
VDGLLEDSPTDVNQLMQHLESCDLCQTSLIKINCLENNLTENLKKRWLFSPLTDEELKALVQSILFEIKQPNSSLKVGFPIRQVGWIAGLAVMFVALAILFIRLTPNEQEFPQVDATATPQLPPIIEMQPEISLPLNHGVVLNPPQYIEPDFSSDGKWAVFASIQLDPITQMTLLPTIELYNRETNSIQMISESTARINLPWVWWDHVPSISADGHWIAYTSMSNDPDIAGSSCTTSDQLTCLDIFLYNRESGQTKRITQSVAGAAANGDSFSPTVSAGGQWVAFWSAASNLVDGKQGNCEDGQNISCLFIYLYNQISGKIEQISIGTATTGYVIGVDRISLSADGRLVGFTVTKDKQAQIQLGGDQVIIPSQGNSQNVIGSTPSIVTWNDTEAIVYDRMTGKYEMENQTQDGILGNGDSSSPVLSADGRYVVFSSASTNLVTGDRNGFADVFIRDRTNGKIELISHVSDGSPGNGESGRSGWSGFFYSLNISGDGRYIIYSSLATNLGHAAPVECNPVGLVCNLLYLHDRQTGSTELINDPPTYDFSYFPQISSDGRWVSFMQSENNCSNYQLQCSDVMLYDRQHAWTTNLTKSKEGMIRTPWSYMGSLAIPAEIWERNALAFSPDGSLLALAGNDSLVRIWQISAGINPFSKSDPDISLGVGEKEYYTSVAFSPDGKWLAAGTTTRAVFIWKIPEGVLLYTLEVESGPIKDLKFSPDRDQLVVSSNMEAEIWQVDKDQLVRVNSFSYGLTSVYDVAISPRANIVASARGDGTVWLQTIPTGQVVSRLGGSRVAVSDMAFSLDGLLLATRSMEGMINIWQISGIDNGAISISLLNTFRTDNLYGPISFSPNNRYLATSSVVGGILLWGVFDGNIYTVSSSTPDGRLDSLAFSNLGDTLAATIVNNDIVLWDINPGSSSTFFVHALWDSYGDSGPMPLATANDILMLREPAGLSVDDHLSLDQTAADLAFPLLVPADLPENISLREARVNIDGSAWLEYEASDQGGVQAGLYIYEQAIGNTVPPTMTIGASAAVIQIPLITASGMEIADYVQGDWIWSRYYNSQDSTHYDSWDWYVMKPTQRLRWQQQGIFIALYYQVTSPFERMVNQPVSNEFVPLDNLLTQQDLVQIAKGILPFSEANGMIPYDILNLTDTVTPVSIKSIGNVHSCLSSSQVRQQLITNVTLVTK